MSARHKTRRNQIGRGRRHQDACQKILQEVDITRRLSRSAYRNYKKAVRIAQNAGLFIPGGAIPEPSIEVTRNSLEIFPGGLDQPDHGHIAVRLSGELSPECLAELAEKITNGKVVYDRLQGEDHGWWNYHPQDEHSMSAD